MKTMLINAIANIIPLADKSVHMIVSSPPYYNLRRYLVDGELGQEKLHDCLGWARGEAPCDNCFVCNLRKVAAECWRVLRDDGTLFLNLGDSYNGSGKGGVFTGKSWKQATNAGANIDKKTDAPGLKPKDLIGIPWRVALALQADGWYLRADIPWIKRGVMPESVTDRPVSSTEYIFLLSKSKKYYYDRYAVMQPLAESTKNDYILVDGRLTGGEESKYNTDSNAPWYRQKQVVNPVNGRNFRNADPFKWTLDEQIDYLIDLRDNGGTLIDQFGNITAIHVPPGSYKGAHFATFPPKLITHLIKAGTSEVGCCPHCGAGWRRVVEKGVLENYPTNPNPVLPYTADGATNHGTGETTLHKTRTVQTVEWVQDCDCPEHDPTPCIVFDPFVGSGTTLEEARRLGRSGVGSDLSFDYLVNQAKKRLGLTAVEALENGLGLTGSPKGAAQKKAPKNQMKLL